MAAKITINSERCKGCGLCISVCPKNSIAISKKSNKVGYFPAQVVNADCTGCAMCAIMCPDAIIEVYSDGPGRIAIVAMPAKKAKTSLVEEKA